MLRDSEAGVCLSAEFGALLESQDFELGVLFDLPVRLCDIGTKDRLVVLNDRRAPGEPNRLLSLPALLLQAEDAARRADEEGPG